MQCSRYVDTRCILSANAENSGLHQVPLHIKRALIVPQPWNDKP